MARPRWVLDPLAGVGPVRFGMSQSGVEAVLTFPELTETRWSGGGGFWTRYRGEWEGMTLIHGQDGLLAAVAVDALRGPRVWIDDVELVDRVPSRVQEDIHRLAGEQSVEVRVNFSGDPEVPAWGVSMGTEADCGLDGTRRDGLVTSALLCGPGIAEDPYESAPIIHWRDVDSSIPPRSPGVWPVIRDEERPQWEWTPMQQVGPLVFGMSPHEVAAVLGEQPAHREGAFPSWFWKKSGVWDLRTDHFPGAGVSAHYGGPVPRLGGVTIHGRTGPQLHHWGIALTGISPTVLDAAIMQYAEDTPDAWLRFSSSGAAVPADVQLSIGIARTGDTCVSEPSFYQADWDMF
ncbi:hypothetical protein ACIRO3_34485 [Streptomyces sp. NPDC102278]|uniref:hypothetical protein n=1 Tax=Streptomyces sp. NPDC102278 TaxID=3366152 RepID=UPI00382C6E45